jgi:hypothetical protein
MKKNLGKTQGDILVSVLVFAAIAVTVTIGLVNWGALLLTSVRTVAQREQVLQIAEAGVDYYRWHLAHAPLDFQDGTGHAGPYTHQFADKDGNTIGSYILTITPPLVGSTIVTIVSKGTLATSTISRSVKVVMGIPSLAQYAMVTNSAVYYGSGDNVFGPIHSNVGVGFWSGSPQPIAHNMVTSGVSTFTDTSANSNCPGTHFGVYTCVPNADPAPPAAVPSRPDVFAGGRQFPVPAIDFTSITADLNSIKSQANTGSGFYRSSSGASGYKVVLKTNGTFDLYKVNSLLPAPNGCTNSYAGGQVGWGTWSINVVSGVEQSTLLGNYPIPANGLMFFEDNVWVQGTINKSRVTIAVGTFPSTNKNIIVNNDLKYTNFDGQDSIGLIAQGNFLVGLSSADSLTIDGALIAQNGGTIRYYYTSSCPGYLRTTLTTYGMFGSNGQGYFYYGDSGYTSQPASYDANFLYGPPPSFPLTSSFYNTLSWQEI